MCNLQKYLIFTILVPPFLRKKHTINSEHETKLTYTYPSKLETTKIYNRKN